jgi:hypothetical protein
MELPPDPTEPEIGPSTLTWIDLPSRSFVYEAVLRGIANADHASEPSIGSKVYFMNTGIDAIIHMYDDRGMDMIATSRKTLRVLYHNFNQWILDYDRATIDRAFALGD